MAVMTEGQHGNKWIRHTIGYLMDDVDLLPATLLSAHLSLLMRQPTLHPPLSYRRFWTFFSKNKALLWAYMNPYGQ
jgi:hypothetical protein